MKLFIISNDCDDKKIVNYLGKAKDIIKQKLNLDFDWEFEFLRETAEYELYYTIGEKPYRGLNKYLINRWNTNAIGCGAILYFYKAYESNVYNWCDSENGRPQIQIVYQETDLLPEIIAHELCHGLFANLREKGIYLNDSLDFGEEENRLMVLLENLEKLKGYEEKLEETLPIDKKISILEKIIELAKQALDLLNGIRKLSDLGVAMAKMEGFYLYGSRAYKNNNPLNLGYIGQELAIGADKSNLPEGSPFNGFCIFKTVEDGWKACYNDLKYKIKKHPDWTIEELIKTWSATDQKDYLNFVCDLLKIPSDFQIRNFYW